MRTSALLTFEASDGDGLESYGYTVSSSTYHSTLSSSQFATRWAEKPGISCLIERLVGQFSFFTCLGWCLVRFLCNWFFLLVFLYWGFNRLPLPLRKTMGKMIGQLSGSFLREVFKDWCLQIWVSVEGDLLWSPNRPGVELRSPGNIHFCLFMNPFYDIPKSHLNCSSTQWTFC